MYKQYQVNYFCPQNIEISTSHAAKAFSDFMNRRDDRKPEVGIVLPFTPTDHFSSVQNN